MTNGPLAGGKIGATGNNADAGQYSERPFHRFLPNQSFFRTWYLNAPTGIFRQARVELILGNVLHCGMILKGFAIRVLGAAFI
jgi:hypothetical protein